MLSLTLAAKSAVLALLAVVSLAPPALRGTTAGISPAATVEHNVYGTVQSLAGNTLVIRTRSGQLRTVDGRQARSFVRLQHNRPVIVTGTLDAGGVIHARSVWRVNTAPAFWPADR